VRPVATAHPDAGPVVEQHGVLAVEERLQLANSIEVDDGRPVGSLARRR
jgi:hypothetical protein